MDAGFNRLGGLIPKAANNAIVAIANEVLRLSMKEVPHDTGQLQTTGQTQPVSDDQIDVGYNKVYAARLHEHPEYRFQKGRKGKYLTDPIMHNLGVFKSYIEEEVQKALR